jgi:septal ring factor EnvC (AmiA/AmiB activator)
VPPFNLPAPAEHHLIPTHTLDILIREKQEL